MQEGQLDAGVAEAPATRRSLHRRRLACAAAFVIGATGIIGGIVARLDQRFVLRTIELSGAPDPSSVLAEPSSWRSRSMDALVLQAWVAGSQRRFIAAPPGGAPMLRLRRLRLTERSLDSLEPVALRSRLGPN